MRFERVLLIPSGTTEHACALPPIFWMLSRAPDDGSAPADVVKLIDQMRPRGPRIRCPKCRWVPCKDSRWCCLPECGMIWNTFDTAGKCPRCSKQWVVTQCLACHKRALHVDWYESGSTGPWN